MIDNLIKTLIILLILTPLTLHAEDLRQVTIRDSNFDIIKKLNSSVDLEAFSVMWSKKIETPSNNLNWNFKIDIEPGDRWLYSSDGWATVLTIKTKNPIYKIFDVIKFNKLLGIENTPLINTSK